MPRAEACTRRPRPEPAPAADDAAGLLDRLLASLASDPAAGEWGGWASRLLAGDDADRGPVPADRPRKHQGPASP